MIIFLFICIGFYDDKFVLYVGQKFLWEDGGKWSDFVLLDFFGFVLLGNVFILSVYLLYYDVV